MSRGLALPALPQPRHRRVRGGLRGVKTSTHVRKSVLSALADAVGPSTSERDHPVGSIYVRAAHKAGYAVSFDTPRAGWMGPRPYTGQWVRWCVAVDAVIAELMASGVVAAYATPSCWSWGKGLVRGYTEGYWLASRPAPKHACMPWAPLPKWEGAASAPL